MMVSGFRFQVSGVRLNISGSDKSDKVGSANRANPDVTETVAEVRPALTLKLTPET